MKKLLKYYRTKVVVLIDAENVDEQSFLESSRLVNNHFSDSTISYKAIADFSKSNVANVWKQLCFDHFIEPIHFFAYGGKGNQSDFALCCYAVSLIDSYHSFVLVSDDSDFISLALFLRNKGVPLTGVGNNPASLLKKACQDYIVVDDGVRDNEANSNVVSITGNTIKGIKVERKLTSEHKHLLDTFKRMRKDCDGYVPLGTLKKRSGVECDMKFSQYVEGIKGFVLSADHQSVRLKDGIRV